MPTLALDLATRTGWAFRASSGEVTSGFIDCKPLRKEGKISQTPQISSGI